MSINSNFEITVSLGSKAYVSHLERLYMLSTHTHARLSIRRLPHMQSKSRRESKTFVQKQEVKIFGYNTRDIGCKWDETGYNEGNIYLLTFNLGSIAFTAVL